MAHLVALISWILKMIVIGHHHLITSAKCFINDCRHNSAYQTHSPLALDNGETVGKNSGPTKLSGKLDGACGRAPCRWHRPMHKKYIRTYNSMPGFPGCWFRKWTIDTDIIYIYKILSLLLNIYIYISSPMWIHQPLSTQRST